MKKISVFLIAAAMLLAFTASVSASEFSFYGNARLNTFSWENSKEVNAKSLYGVEMNTNNDDSTINDSDLYFNESDRDLDLSLTPISRFGAKITVSDELTANIEFGVGGSSSSNNLRHLYGEYDFGAGKILVGQTWHPFAVNVGYSNQVGNVDDGLGSTGAFGTGRKPQIRLSFGDFAIHFMQPSISDIPGIGNGLHTDDVTNAHYWTNNEFDEYDASWPHIAAVYNAAYENFTFGITGAFQTYEVSDTRGDYYEISTGLGPYDTLTGRSYDVDSHAVKLGIQGDFGILKLGATYGFGQNVGNMGLDSGSKKGGATPQAFYRGSRSATTGIFTGVDAIGNVDTTAYTIVGSFKVNDQVTLEAGYGKVSNDLDDALKNDEASAYYLQAAFTVADGFTVTPEIGKYDYEQDCNGKDEGDATYFGAKWQINF
jgi:hypothetical protein